MIETIQGKIISSSLGEFSKKKIVYGYIGIELSDKKHVKIKIDAYTWYESLSLGNEVVIEVEVLANTDILVARKIQLRTSTDASPEEATATT
ncbi:MAG: hypothetical protein AM325_012995 [Candidatus Thorarchaeota archaeon SMTZ1-45]|nr:MAG: hypothetical protein AM325_14660 [Candidatus Thorarchaeota archaeon SMTZ1-45]